MKFNFLQIPKGRRMPLLKLCFHVAMMAHILLTFTRPLYAHECGHVFFSPLKADAATTEDNQRPAKIDDSKAGGLGTMYFSLTRRFGNGTFDDHAQSLAALRELDIDILWTSPNRTQSVMQMRDQVNDHGYWWLDPSEIDPLLG